MTGEGIYYAIRSGHMAGEAFRDLQVAVTLAKVVYRFPKVAYTALKSSEDLRLLYLDVLAGNARYEAFLRKIAARLRRALGGKITATAKMSSPVD
jgi:flavin-dependent dehydrogenase